VLTDLRLDVELVPASSSLHSAMSVHLSLTHLSCEQRIFFAESTLPDI